MPRFTCHKCGATRESKMITPWKNHRELVWCSTCWGAAFIMRQVAIPVAVPAGHAEREEFTKSLHAAWHAAASLANWAMTELSTADFVRTADMEQMPPMPEVTLYERFTGFQTRPRGTSGPRVRIGPGYSDQAAWDGFKASALCVLRMARDRYVEDRRAVKWDRRRSLASFKVPLPFPIHNEDWPAAFDDQGRPTVTVTMPGGKWPLRLRGGPEFARQLASFRQIVSGEACKGAASLYARPTTDAAGRLRVFFREPGGGESRPFVVWFGMAAWLPRTALGERVNEMILMTDPNAFAVAETADRRPWVLNGDHLRRWAAMHAHWQRVADRHAAHDVYRQRMAEDTKYEKRWPARRRQQMNESRERRCAKHRRRVESFLQESTAMIAGLARRQMVRRVTFDESKTSALRDFPWHRFRVLLGQKLDAEGIEFQVASHVQTGA